MQLKSSPVAHHEGFTLIELLITVVIIGILAAIAYPSYINSVYKSRRSDAEAALLESANYMERKYTEFNSYDTDNSGNKVTLPAGSGTDYYDIKISAQSDSSFTLQAQPIGAQAGDSCGTLSVTNTGVKQPSNCW